MTDELVPEIKLPDMKDTVGESAEDKAKRSVDEIRQRILDNLPKEE